MNGKDLLEGMSYVDEQLVDEAETGVIRGASRRVWMRWASLAACLCVVVVGAFVYRNFYGSGITETTGEITPTGATEAAPMPTEAMTEAMAYPPASEAAIPSAILRVESWLEDGFAGVVEEVSNMPELAEGEQVFVVIGEDAMVQLPYYENDPNGTVRVEVLPYTYDVENNTLYVELVTPIE